MASYMMVRHRVRDFGKWKVVYDEHQGARKKAGLTEVQLLRGIEDGNDVVLLFEAKSAEKTRAFSDAPNTRETMNRAGVMARPEVLFLNSA